MEAWKHGGMDGTKCSYFSISLIEKNTVMKKNNAKFLTILICFISSGIACGQWVSVLDNVTPVDIAISPDYINDQTVYILDDEQRLWISESGGMNWTTLYEAADAQDPSQTVLDILLSPNFRNDNAIVMIHKDGTAKVSADRGQQWFTLPVPEGTSGIVFSAKVMTDYSMFAITGAYGPVKFYKSPNGGAAWDLVSDLGIGGGFYCRLWNSSDTASISHMALLYDNRTVYMTADAGGVWANSFEAQVSVRDFVFSPKFSEDQTVFVADASEIFKSESSGSELSWLSTGTFPDSYGIKFAISPGYAGDQTIFAAIDKVGILRSDNGGITWNEFNDGFGSTLPISIAISQHEPYTLFAGSMQSGGTPDKLWRYQTSSGTAEHDQLSSLDFYNFPNPFSTETEIIFETPSAGHVKLCIYDITGKNIKVLVNENLGKGMHQVKLNCDDKHLYPGIYFCRLEAKDRSQVIKLIAGQW
jgi:photosystem II stability/assembly factor-like uncharacterized protein